MSGWKFRKIRIQWHTGMFLRCRSHERLKLWGASANEQMVAEMPMKWHERIRAPLSEWMNQWANESMNNWINESVNGWTNEATKQWLNESTNQWTNESVKRWMDEWMNGWMDEWMNERTNERTNEWMNESMDGRTRANFLCWAATSSLSDLLAEVPLLWIATTLGYFCSELPPIWAASQLALVELLQPPAAIPNRTRVALWSITTFRSAVTMRFGCKPAKQERHTKSTSVRAALTMRTIPRYSEHFQFLCETELSPQSCALFVDNFLQSRRRDLLRRPRKPLYPKKHPVSRPIVFSPVNSRAHFPTTWWRVVGMMMWLTWWWARIFSD